MAADTTTDDILTNISTCSYAFESTHKKVMPNVTQKGDQTHISKDTSCVQASVLFNSVAHGMTMLPRH